MQNEQEIFKDTIVSLSQFFRVPVFPLEIQTKRDVEVPLTVRELNEEEGCRIRGVRGERVKQERWAITLLST